MHLRAFAAALALVIGAALVWVIAAGSEDSQPTERVTSPQEKKAVRLEKQAAEHPNDEGLQLNTMKAWIRAGADRLEAINTRTDPIPPAVVEDYKSGLRAWNDYLQLTDGEASRDSAETVAVAYFQLVEIGSRDPSEATANAAGAVRAEKIVCKHDAVLYTLSNLAIYHYFNGEYPAGDKAAKEAAADIKAGDAIKPREVIEELNEYKELGEKFVGRVKQGSETLEETGEEELETPIKGYGSPAGINGYEPGTGPT
jgi:hypothetical protein